MSERKIELIMEWIERNPAAFKKVRDKVDDLGSATKAAYRTVAHGLVLDKQTQTAQEATADSFTDGVDAILSTIPSYKQAKDIQARMTKEAMRTQIQIRRLGDQLKKAGRHVGFYGWIISYAARSMVRNLSQVFNWFIKLIKVSAEWPESLEKVALAMGLLQSQGLLSADMAELLRDTMQRLIKDGPKFQALWAGFEALFIAVATIITSDMLPSLTELLNILAEFLLREDVRALLVRLGDQFVQLAEALIPALPNLLTVISLLLDLANALSPLFPILIPLIPVIMALGSVLWILGPILTTSGTLIGLLSGAIGWMATQLGIGSAAATTMAPTMHYMGAAAATASGGFWSMAASVAAVVAPVALLAAGIVALTILILGVADAIKGAQDALASQAKAQKDYFEGTITMAEYAADKVWRHSFFPELISWAGRGSEAMSTLAESFSLPGLPAIPGREGGGIGGGPQYVTIYSTVEVGNISSEMDLDRVFDTVNRSLGEAIRRARG